MNTAQIVAAIAIIVTTEFILSATLIWRPRLLEVINDRNIWRDRAITAEDHADKEDIDIRVLTDWGSATDTLGLDDE